MLRYKHDSVVGSWVNICVQIAGLPYGHCEEHLRQPDRHDRQAALQPILHMLGAHRTEARFKSGGQGFSSSSSSGAKLVCPTGLTFDLTRPAADAFDNQRNLSFFALPSNSVKSKRYAAENGFGPAFLASFYPRMKE